MFSGLLRSCRRLMNATTWRPNMNQNMTQFHEMSAPLGWQEHDNWKDLKSFGKITRSAVYIGFNGFKWLLSSGHQHWYPCLTSSMVLSELVAATPICHMLYRTHTKFQKPVNTRWSLSMFKIKLDTLKGICTTVVGTTLLHTSSLNYPCAALLCEGYWRIVSQSSAAFVFDWARRWHTAEPNPQIKHIWIWKPKKKLDNCWCNEVFWCHGQISWNSKLFLKHFEGIRLRIWRHGGSVWPLSDLVAERFTFWCQHAKQYLIRHGESLIWHGQNGWTSYSMWYVPGLWCSTQLFHHAGPFTRGGICAEHL